MTKGEPPERSREEELRMVKAGEGLHTQTPAADVGPRVAGGRVAGGAEAGGVGGRVQGMPTGQVGAGELGFAVGAWELGA